MLNYNLCVVKLCSDGSINRQECTSFDIYAITIKISMIEYHHKKKIKKNVFLMVYSNTTLYGGNDMVYPVTGIFSLITST